MAKKKLVGMKVHVDEELYKELEHKGLIGNQYVEEITGKALNCLLGRLIEDNVPAAHIIDY